MDLLAERMLDSMICVTLQRMLLNDKRWVIFLTFSDMEFSVERFSCSRINYLNYDV